VNLADGTGSENLNKLASFWLAPFKAVEAGHTETSWIFQLLDYLRSTYSDVAVENWPQELASHVFKKDGFAHQVSVGCESVIRTSLLERLDDDDRMAIELLSNLATSPRTPPQFSLQCFSPSRSKRSHPYGKEITVESGKQN
jgi:hypothetical protein